MSAYLGSLCTGYNSDAPGTCQKGKKMEQGGSASFRKKRMTFILDRCLVKMTRKNLNAAKNGHSTGLGLQIEDHLFSRLSELTVVSIQGPFSDGLLKSLPFSFKMVEPSQKGVNPICDSVMVNQKLNIRLREGTVDALVFSKSKNSLKLIENTLNCHKNLVENFVFIVDKQIDFLQLRELLVVFKEYFVF
jgi:hypothetical protein